MANNSDGKIYYYKLSLIKFCETRTKIIEFINNNSPYMDTVDKLEELKKIRQSLDTLDLNNNDVQHSLCEKLGSIDDFIMDEEYVKIVNSKEFYEHVYEKLDSNKMDEDE
jgi:hypothetical protein